LLFAGFSGVNATLRFKDPSGSTYGYWGDKNSITDSNGRSWCATGAGLSACYNNLGGLPGTIFLPGNKTIVMTSNISLYSGFAMEGQGMESTVLDASGISGYAIEASEGLASAVMDAQLSGFTLDGNNDTGGGICLRNCWNTFIDRVDVKYFNTGVGINLDGGSVGSSGLKATNCYFYNNSKGVVINNSGTSFCTINRFVGCIINNNGVGINITQGGGAVANTEFDGCQVEGNSGWGAYLGTFVGCRFINCWFEQNNLSGLTGEIYISGSAWSTSFIGGSLSISHGKIQINQVSSAGYGVSFEKVSGQSFLDKKSSADYIIFKHEFNGTKYFLQNGTNGGIERVGTFVVIMNHANTNLGASGGTILLKKGNYTCTDPLYINSKIILKGEGTENTVIYGKRLRITGDNCGVEDLTLSGSDAEGISVEGCNYTFLRDLRITGYATNPIVVSGGAENISIYNVEGVAGFTVPCYNQSFNVTGAIWFDTATNILNVYNGTAWVSTTLT